MRAWVLLWSVVLGTGCSLFGGKTAEAPKKEVKDVPYSARRGDGDIRKRLLVLPFLDSSTERSKKVAEEARKSLLRALSKTERFVLISPQDFPRDLSTFVVNGDYDLEQIAKIGEGLGLAAVLEGKVLEIKARRLGDEVGMIRKFKAQMDASVRIRMTTIRNGREVLNEVRSSTVEATTTRFGDAKVGDAFLNEDPALVDEAVTKAFRGAVPNIVRAVEKLGWEGRIAQVQGNRIFLNAGRLSGLNVGDLLKVTGAGQEIFDPETGDLIGEAPGPMRGTLELVSYFGKDGAIAVIHSGSGFRENDLVELY